MTIKREKKYTEFEEKELYALHELLCKFLHRELTVYKTTVVYRRETEKLLGYVLDDLIEKQKENDH